MFESAPRKTRLTWSCWSGKHLDLVKACTVVPVSSPASLSASGSCTVATGFIAGSGQLAIQLRLPKGWAVGNLLVTLQDQAKQGLAVTGVLATTSDAQPSQPSQTPSGAPQGSSPFASCLNASAVSSPVLNSSSGAPLSVNCASSLLTDGEVKDNFGQHVGHTYYAIQVRVSNQNSNFDFLLRDVLLTLPDGRVVSGRIRRFAQGVAVKGRSLDRRAVFYNSLQATTGLYGALAVFASTGFKTVGNVLQGSFLSGFTGIFPDYTADNVNRFNTAVFDDQNPAIVPKDSIGQPPLYVVALVPKLPGTDKDPHYAEKIAVSVEGTYIKQVSLVTLSTTSVDFGAEYISPDKETTLLATDDSGITALRAQGVERSFTISNNNSSPMNISKLTLTTTTKSSTTLVSTVHGVSIQDFEVDNAKSLCSGSSAASGGFSADNSFTIPAQGFCTIYVRFHPVGIGQSSATLNLEGSALDGPRTIALTGKSIGLIVNAVNVPLLKGTGGVAKPTFACSYQGDCQLNLGFVDNNTEADLQIAVVGPDTSGQIFRYAG